MLGRVTISMLVAWAGFAMAADNTGSQTMSWEQKQEQIKSSASEQVQLKDQIKTLTQQMEQAATPAEKQQIQAQITQKEQQLVQVQTQYQIMLAAQTAAKYEFKDANGDGINDNCAGSTNEADKAWMYKNGYGYGYGFADKNGDGINDNFVDADQDGKCDINPEMTRTRDQIREKAKGDSQHGDHAKNEQSHDQIRTQTNR